MLRGLKIAGMALAACLTSFAAIPVFAGSLSIEVTTAVVEADPVMGQPVVRVALDAESTKAFAEFTAAHLGSKIEIRLGSKVLMAPVIQEPINGGMFMITGSMTQDDAREIVASIESGDHKLVVDAGN